MAWELNFYRRVGQPALTVAETDAFFGRQPGFVREVFPPSEENAAEAVVYRWTGVEEVGELAYAMQTLPPETETDPGRADFPYEETGLVLHLPYMQSPETAGVAFRTSAELHQELELLALDPQNGQEIPGVPEEEALARSYAAKNRELGEMVEAMRQRRRRFLAIALALLVAGILLMLLTALGVIDDGRRSTRNTHPLRVEQVASRTSALLPPECRFL